MENLLLKFNSLLLPCFSGEVLCIFAIVLNLFSFVFLKRKTNTKRFSDIITSFVFLINCAGLWGVYFKNHFAGFDLNILYFKNLLLLNNETLFLKGIVNLFALCFVLTTYKIIRKKARFKTPVVNSILLLIVCLSSLFVQSQNFILTFILLDMVVFLIYQYASNLRINKNNVYSFDFISISGCATVLLITFLILTYSIQTPLQMSIIKVCLALALLLKIGIFPIYNYIINRNYKINIPYSILLYSYLPFLGVIAFNKMAQLISFTDEAYQMIMLVFVFVTMFIFSLYCFKTKNVIKFITYCSYFAYGVCILGILFLSTNFLSLKLASNILFCTLALYSLICVLKINLKPDKINISIFQNLFVNNKFFVFAFSFLLLMLSFVMPSFISKTAVDLLSQIYLFDKISEYFIFGIISCDILIIFNVFKYIEQCYRFDKNAPSLVLTKRTAMNYAVLLMIIICLILFMFL